MATYLLNAIISPSTYGSKKCASLLARVRDRYRAETRFSEGKSITPGETLWYWRRSHDKPHLVRPDDTRPCLQIWFHRTIKNTTNFSPATTVGGIASFTRSCYFANNAQQELVRKPPKIRGSRYQYELASAWYCRKWEYTNRKINHLNPTFIAMLATSHHTPKGALRGRRTSHVTIESGRKMEYSKNSVFHE